MQIPQDLYSEILRTMPITCIDALVRNKKGQYLLVKRVHEPLKGIYWTPGGRVFKNERLVDAVVRILKREINCDVESSRPSGYFEDFFSKSQQNVPGGVHTLSFVFSVTLKSEDIVLDKTSIDWIWADHLPERYKNYTEVLKEF